MVAFDIRPLPPFVPPAMPAVPPCPAPAGEAQKSKKRLHPQRKRRPAARLSPAVQALLEATCDAPVRFVLLSGGHVLHMVGQPAFVWTQERACAAYGLKHAGQLTALYHRRGLPVLQVDRLPVAAPLQEVQEPDIKWLLRSARQHARFEHGEDGDAA